MTNCIKTDVKPLRHIEGRTQAEGAEEDMWSYEGEVAGDWRRLHIDELHGS